MTDGAELESANGYLLNIGENGNEDALQLVEVSSGQQTIIAEGNDGLVAQGPVQASIKMSWEEDILVVAIDTSGIPCFEVDIEAPIDPNLVTDEFYFGIICTYTSSRSDKFFFDNFYIGPTREDRSAPRVENVFASANELKIDFSEPVVHADIDRSFSISPDVSDIIINKSKTSVALSSQSGFSNQVPYQLSLINWQDPSGNSLDTILTVEVAWEPEGQDLRLNEILFNPIGDGADYVEIFNASDGLISLGNVLLINDQNGDQDQLMDLPPLKSQDLIVVTDDRSDIISRYPTMMQVRSLKSRYQDLITHREMLPLAWVNPI